MTMQRLRCARLAENHAANYRARCEQLDQGRGMELQVRGTSGGGRSNYGRAITEPGWGTVARELLERK